MPRPADGLGLAAGQRARRLAVLGQALVQAVQDVPRLHHPQPGRRVLPPPEVRHLKKAAIDDPGVEQDRVAAAHRVLQEPLVVDRGGDLHEVAVVPVLLDRLVGGEAGARPRLRHEGDLALELVRHPLVVGVEVGDVAAPGVREPPVARQGDAPVGGLGEGPEPPVPLRQLLDQRSRPVLRGVVDREHLQVRHGLGQGALQRLEDVRLAVVGGDDHGDEGRGAVGRALIDPAHRPLTPSADGGTFRGDPSTRRRPSARRTGRDAAIGIHRHRFIQTIVIPYEEVRPRPREVLLDVGEFIRSTCRTSSKGNPRVKFSSASPFFNASRSQGRRYITSRQHTSNDITRLPGCLTSAAGAGSGVRPPSPGVFPPDPHRRAGRDRRRTTGAGPPWRRRASCRLSPR